MERFVQKNGVPKNGFPIVFSKSDLAGGGAFFEPKSFSEKAKLPGMCPSFAGNVGETQFHQCQFIPPSYEYQINTDFWITPVKSGLNTFLLKLEYIQCSE